MPPFIEIGKQVFLVIGWEPNMPDRERYELRRLSAKETKCYQHLKRESEVELWANFRAGD